MLTRFRRLVLLLAAASLSACLPLQPVIVVTPAPPRPIAFHVCYGAVDVRVNGPSIGGDGTDSLSTTTNTDGNATFAAIPASLHAFNLFLTAEGSDAYSRVVALPDGGHDYFVGDCGAALASRDIVLPAFVTPGFDTGERGAVRVVGQRFVRADGRTFPWRGFTAFQLYLQWLHGGAEAIRANVEDLMTCGGRCHERGPNVVRVLGMVDSFAHLWPQEHGERFYSELRPFVDYLWARFHLRVEFVIFADAQNIMPDRGQEWQHAQRVHAALQTAENVFLEIANEPFKNLPGGGMAAADIGRTLQNRGPPVASGDYDTPWLTALDYLTVHTDRGPEWPRKAKDLLDIRAGDVGVDVGGWRSPGPVVGDEPIGFADVERPSRSASADDAAQFAAACQMFSAGCTFHSDAGIAFTPLGMGQAIAADAFFRAMHFVPPDAQFAPYTRGDTQAGCHWVPGASFVEHDDAFELRSFGKAVGGEVFVVQIRTTRPTALACAGWRVVEQPRRGLVRLTAQF